MKYLVVLSILFLAACKKDGYEYVSSFQGDYDLAYIKVSNFEYMTPEDVDHKVGLRILDNGNIETYIDGDFHRRYKLQRINGKSNDTLRPIYTWENNNEVTVKLFESNKLVFPAFPYDGKQNYFYKK